MDVVVDPHVSLGAWFMSREDVIAAKLAVGRQQGLGDIAMLRAAHPDRNSVDN